MVRTAALIIVAALTACTPRPACENEDMALVMAHDFIKRQLKAPASADFPSRADSGVTVVKTDLGSGKCEFMVGTYVDAQNSFGANIRTQFFVTLSPDDASGKSWSLKEIIGG